MMVTLRPMTTDEFVAYEQAGMYRYADRMVHAGFWSPERALEQARNEHSRLIPLGRRTRDHRFFIVEEPGRTGAVGALWIAVDHSTSPPSGLIYDLLIHEAFRNQGYGRQAVLALEEKAVGMGLSALRLHIFEDNIKAKRPCASLGYQVKSHNMTKNLPPAG
jgi:RimJ/RimL family protein N-acetyltransferase